VERILGFHADIEVDARGTLAVRETIRVQAEGEQIRRGIYRDFPTIYPGRWGLRVRVPFELVTALRDGAPEPWRQERLANGVRTYLGRAEVFLSPGVYTYTIAYRTARQLGFFAEHDELYWNVTGLDWSFPIDRASATVTLPPGVPRDALRLDAYTGPAGARGRDWAARVDAGGRPTFATTAPLGRQEGLTIVVGWPKGVVAPPTAADRVRALLDSNRTLAVGAAGVALLLAFYLVVWVRVGRDPAGGVIIPRFAPPGGLSPAAVRYVWKMEFDDRAFTAAIIDMAVKGYLTIEGDGRAAGGDTGYRLVRRPKADAAALAPAERKVAAALFGPLDEVRLARQNHARVGQARRTLRDELAREHDRVTFRTNRGWFAWGMLLSLLTVAAAVVAEASAGGDTWVLVLFLSVWLTAWTFGTAMLWIRRQWVMAVFFTVFGLMAAGGIVLAGSPPALALLAGLGTVNTLFYHLLRAPTRAGRRLLDEIEGLRMYLSVAERDRLNALHPPEETPETFERFLPYAFALDVDQAWAERFQHVLAPGPEGTPGGYSPHWHRALAGGSRGFSPAALGASLGALGTAVAAASTPPGSTSGGRSSGGGGGGGGSSGGGGGGGGGGGW
jgi:uncharacterized membrane protein YgcG